MRSGPPITLNPVKKLREALGMGRDEFAEMFGLKAPTIEKYESEPPDDWLEKLEDCARGNDLTAIAEEFAYIKRARAGELTVVEPEGKEEQNALRILRRLKAEDPASYQLALKDLAQIEQAHDLRLRANAAEPKGSGSHPRSGRRKEPTG